MPKKAPAAKADAAKRPAPPPLSPDVQAFDAPRPYHLTRVGVRGVKKPVTVRRPHQKAQGVVATFDLFVDLPKTQKGTHMSRNLEALADTLDEDLANEASSLENVCGRVAEHLIRKHESATHAHVRAEADYFLTRKNPGGKPSVEAYRILAEADSFRAEAPAKPPKAVGTEGSAKSTKAVGTQASAKASKDVGAQGSVKSSSAVGTQGSAKSATRTLRRIGVQVVGMSACPCAMETVRHKLGAKVPADLPFITHNQRNRVILVIDLPGDADVEAADLVELCESGLSAPTFELLKRGDEGDLVLQAHLNPRFVEDVVREVLHKAKAKYGKLGPTTRVFVSSEAEESIHKHNAYAERHTTFGELE